MNGPSFEKRTKLIDAAKALAASNGSDLDRYKAIFTAIGEVFTECHGVDCEVTLTPNHQQAQAIIDNATALESK